MISGNSALDVNTHIHLKRIICCSIGVECRSSIIFEPADVGVCRIFKRNILGTQPDCVFLSRYYFVRSRARISDRMTCAIGNDVSVFIQIAILCILDIKLFAVFVHHPDHFCIRRKNFEALASIDGSSIWPIDKCARCIVVFLHNPVGKPIAFRCRRGLYRISNRTVDIQIAVSQYAFRTAIYVRIVKVIGDMNPFSTQQRSTPFRMKI